MAKLFHYSCVLNLVKSSVKLGTVFWYTFGSILTWNTGILNYVTNKTFFTRQWLTLTFANYDFLCTFVFYELSRSWFVFYPTPVSCFWQAGTFQYCFCATRAFFNQIFSRTREKNKTRQKIQFPLTKPSQIGKVHQRCIYFFVGLYSG